MTLAGRRCRSPTYLVVLPPRTVLSQTPRAVTRGSVGGAAVQCSALARTAPAGPKEQGGGGGPCS